MLAAGRGVRLGQRGREIPKGFLEIAGTSLIERSLKLLRARGVRRVLAVTGHLAERYQALAGLECVHNPDYARLGSLRSLQCAAERVQGEVLLLESDLIFEERALDALQETDSVLLSGPTGAGDEVWVEAPGGLLRAMSKDPSRLGQVDGELVGISRLSRGLLERVCEMDPALEYETGGLVGCARSRPIRCLKLDSLRWAEVDDEAQYGRARDLFERD